MRAGMETTRPSIGCTMPSQDSWKRLAASLTSRLRSRAPPPRCCQPCLRRSQADLRVEDDEADRLEAPELDVVEGGELGGLGVHLAIELAEALLEVGA